MCGIFGINSNKNIIDKLVQGLERLEYRGYDSAGLAGMSNGEIFMVKVVGKVNELRGKLNEREECSSMQSVNHAIMHACQSTIGIAHTRWATHGEPALRNTHPMCEGGVAVVHNGIIENDDELRATLGQVQYSSDTDTETILHLIRKHLSQQHTPLEAVKLTMAQLKGSFAIVVMFKDQPFLIAAKRHSPMVIGYGADGMYISSDIYSLAGNCDSVTYLQDDDIAVVNNDSVQFFSIHHQGKVAHDKVKLDAVHLSADKGPFSHYMQKEIFEQPDAVHRALSADVPKVTVPSQICIVACGTSYFAGLIAKWWLTEIAKIQTTVEIASEFRIRSLPPAKGTLGIFLSQSGETADTINALMAFKDSWQQTVAITNSSKSTLARSVDIALPIHAGQEVGVASTKAFTNQLVVLAQLALSMALEQGLISEDDMAVYTQSLHEVPGRIAALLAREDEYKDIAGLIANQPSVLYIGRGISYSLALEGALKLKEVSYIHAEAVAAGELKHGHIALVDENMYVIAILPPDQLFEKTLANVKSVTSRKARVILLSSDRGIELLKSDICASVSIPQDSELLTPFLYIVPLQLIAYHVALLKGCNVDQPRNLAKSVTVE